MKFFEKFFYFLLFFWESTEQYGGEGYNFVVWILVAQYMLKVHNIWSYDL
jgi:hypothetical protein